MATCWVLGTLTRTPTAFGGRGVPGGQPRVRAFSPGCPPVGPRSRGAGSRGGSREGDGRRRGPHSRRAPGWLGGAGAAKPADPAPEAACLGCHARSGRGPMSVLATGCWSQRGLGGTRGFSGRPEGPHRGVQAGQALRPEHRGRRGHWPGSPVTRSGGPAPPAQGTPAGRPASAARRRWTG